MLRRELQNVGLDGDAGWYMNVVCCWPRGKPDGVALGACRENLRAQLDVCPRYVLVCGKTALNALLPHAELKHAAGKLIEVHGKLIYPVIHPSFFLWRPDEKSVYKEWQAQLAKFAIIVMMQLEGMDDDCCIYCGARAWPACTKHLGMWMGDSKWEIAKKRSKKKGLQDERLF